LQDANPDNPYFQSETAETAETLDIETRKDGSEMDTEIPWITIFDIFHQG